VALLLLVSLNVNFYASNRIDRLIGLTILALYEIGVPAAEEKKEKPKVEEVDALEGGMDMFGGGGKDY
jgi:hypothetical protein